MAKKESGIMDGIKQGLSMITDIGLNVVMGNLRSAAEDLMGEAQRRVEQATAKVLKALSIFFIMIFGLVLAIVGLGKYLSETVRSLDHGLGYVLVGGILIVLGILFQFFRK